MNHQLRAAIAAVLKYDAENGECLHKEPHDILTAALAATAAPSEKWPTAVPGEFCTRSHPHENMDAECEAKTIVARANYQAAIQRREATAAPSAEPCSWCDSTGKAGDYNCAYCRGNGHVLPSIAAAPSAEQVKPELLAGVVMRFEKHDVNLKVLNREYRDGRYVLIVDPMFTDFCATPHPQPAIPEAAPEQATIPAGFKLVPIEPTYEMVEAVFAGMIEDQDCNLQLSRRIAVRDLLRKVFAAAPPPPQQRDESKEKA